MKTRRHSKFLAGLATGLILFSMFTGPAKAAGGEGPGLPGSSGGRQGDQNALRYPVYRVTFPDLQKTCSIPSSYVITNNSGYIATSTHDLYNDNGDIAYSFMDTISPLASQTYDLSTFSGLPAGYSGYVVVSSTGDISGVVENKYVICGTVNISGVTISDGGGHSAITDSDGNYTLTGLAAGSYTITASRSGYTFSPAASKVTIPPNAWGQDFTATLVSTETATNTTTSTLTPTITKTLTYSPTVTLTFPPTPTATRTSTFTPSITPTVTHITIATSTYTPTPTNIPSHTPTPSPTPTVTRTNTPTPTKTGTLTSMPTSMPPTGTYTPTPTPTGTVTPASNKIFLPIIIKDQSNLRPAGPADDLQGWFQWLWVRLFDQQSPRRMDTGAQADR